MPPVLVTKPLLMKNIVPLFFLLFGFLFFNCSTDKMENSTDTNENPEENPGNGPVENPGESTLYFPPLNSDSWDTVDMTTLGWETSEEQPLYDFLEENNTDAFLILKDGKIVLERYFGDFAQDQNHVWNSAGKTLTAFTVGIAQQEGLLSITDAASDYLGEGWSNLTPDQEQNISLLNQLTMTTGLDYTVADNACTDAECLSYRNEPGAFWFYHNAPYTLLTETLTEAANQDFKPYFNEKLRNKIGMQGIWVSFGYYTIYTSTARSMARFGLLTLNKGTWENETILTNTVYFDAMTTSSQELNPAYGYLWWLNGKDSYRVPGSEISFSGPLIRNAPADLIAGLGKGDQKLYVVPSQGLVIVRMGDDAGETQLGPSSFDNELWEKINTLIGN